VLAAGNDEGRVGCFLVTAGFNPADSELLDEVFSDGRAGCQNVSRGGLGSQERQPRASITGTHTTMLFFPLPFLMACACMRESCA
jgi:hypothetical protein